MYKFVFLDMDDTILDFGAAERVALSKAYRDCGIEPTEELLRRFRVINNMYWERYERGETTRDALLVDRHDHLFRELSIPKSGAAAEERYRQYLGIGHYFIEGAVDCLDYLKSRGYLLYLASNGVAQTQRSRIRSAGIAPYFQEIFISEDSGSHKPEKAYFDYCFSRIPGFDPAKAILIGDSLTSDIRGGLAAGIATCWLNRFGKTAPPDCRPDYEIRRLSEIRQIL